VSSQERTKTKAIVYGAIYGQGNEAAAQSMQAHLGVPVSANDAKLWKASFLQTFPSSKKIVFL